MAPKHRVHRKADRVSDFQAQRGIDPALDLPDTHRELFEPNFPFLGKFGEVEFRLLTQEILDAMFAKWHDAIRSEVNDRQSNAARYSCQEKSNATCHPTRMAVDASGFWSRLQEVFEGSNAPKIAQLTGRTKQTVYRWRDGELPGLDILTEIAESRGVSLHWLATGNGPKLLNGSAQLEEGEEAIYFGPKEREIILKLAGQAKRTFEDEVRELVIEKLEDKGLVTTKTGESNLVFFGDAVPKMIELPFYGDIAAGQPLMIVETVGKISVPDFGRKPNRKYMVLHVRGDSMVDDQIPDGSLIVCEVANTAQPGETVVAVIDGDSATVKKYYPERGRIRLQPANPAHSPQFVTDDRLKIQGIVVMIFHKPQ